MKSNRFYHRPSVLTLGLLAHVQSLISAAPVTFLVDPERSSITLSGSAVGNTLMAQAPGSLTAKFTGAIQVEVTDSTIQFTSGSLIDALPSGAWEPLPGGEGGSAPADYAGTASAGFASANVALRNLLFDVTSSGSVPLANGQFNPAGLSFQFLTNSSGAMDYRVSGFLSTAGSRPLAGLSTNKVATGASLTESNGTRTLTLPIDTTLGFKLLSADDTLLTLKGQLVATAGPGSAKFPVSIRFEGDQLKLQWTGGAGPGFRVEQTPDFKTWSPATGTTTTNGDTTTWTGSLSGSAQYYRITKVP